MKIGNFIAYQSNCHQLLYPLIALPISYRSLNSAHYFRSHLLMLLFLGQGCIKSILGRRLQEAGFACPI